MSLLSLKNPKLYCDVEDICDTKLSKVEKSYEECTNCEKDRVLFSYKFDNGYDLEFSLVYDFNSGLFYGKFSYWELYFMFEQKTEFVFSIKHLELWLFSYETLPFLQASLSKSLDILFLVQGKRKLK